MMLTPVDVVDTGTFCWRWPEGPPELFTRGWDFAVLLGRRRIRVRHGIGRQTEYGRSRVHTVTWLAGAPTVEGVEADDYPRSHALRSVLRLPDKRHVRTHADVPSGYQRFDILNHREEIEAPYSRNSLAVKIVEDDLAAWATHAVLRANSLGRLPQGDRRRPNVFGA